MHSAHKRMSARPCRFLFALVQLRRVYSVMCADRRQMALMHIMAKKHGSQWGNVIIRILMEKRGRLHC